MQNLKNYDKYEPQYNTNNKFLKVKVDYKIK